MDWAQMANLAASALVFVTCTAFVVVYHRLAPWRESRLGRNMMFGTSAFGLLALYTVLITIWPSGETAAVLRTVRTALLVVLAVQIAQRIRMVVEAQRVKPPPPPE